MNMARIRNPHFNWLLRVPFKYQNTYVTLSYLETWLLVHHDPEYVCRLLAWLHYKKGTVGVGGGWRPQGGQPPRPGFAPEGRSFHQDQEFATGFIGAAAVDTVFMDGPDPGDWHDPIAWNEVPKQGSVESRKWGIHANVGVPGNGESWHIQWCDANIGGYDLDGWQSWWNAGRPGPIPNYPLPPEHNPYLEGDEDDMIYLSEMPRMHDSRPGYAQESTVAQKRLTIGLNRRVPIGVANRVGVRLTVVNAAGPGHASVTGTPGLGNPTVNMWNGSNGDGVMFVDCPEPGFVYIASTIECDVILDVFARG